MSNGDTTKQMQEALQAAVTRMNTGSGSAPARPGGDMLGAAMTILPKLLQSSGASEEMLEKLDALKKDELAALREQVQIVRKQCHRMLKFQEDLLSKVHEIQRQQVAAAGAVLDLAQQMARITFIDDAPVDDYEGQGDMAAALDYRPGPRNGRSSRRERET